MDTTANRLLNQALSLPAAERAEIAENLLDSLDNEIDNEAEQQWQEEILRRLADLDSGKTKTIPWSQVRAQFTAQLYGKT